MYNVLTLNKISQTGLRNFDASKYTCSDSFTDPDAVIVRSASMLDMELPESILAIARAGAGYNNIPVDKCTEKGICVFNTPGANANAVKELTLCGLLLCSRRIASAIEWCKGLKGEDEISKKIEKGKSNFAGPEILGKTLGVIGLGAIGVKVSNAAVGLGMNVIGYDPFLSDKAAETLDKSITITSKPEQIFECADYITVHAPLTDDTKGIVGKDTLAVAKDGVRVLNFARGGLVDNDAIIEAVKSGKCTAYATDFPTEEMLDIDGIIALPHLGASTPESEENCAVMAVNQISEYIEKGNVINSVNLPCISKENADGKKRLTAITNGDVSEEIFDAITKTGVSAEDSAASIRKDTGYVIVDDEGITEDTAAAVKNISGVVAVRVIG
ncbi:MAG: 3-phosphoglycerate dehydrogenase [Clostridiales bacterium]|nr:3-phosphoglycerate dehydrogenase [Clostridiales bacterium]